MDSYTYFADFYDELTSNIDYKKRAKYMLDILKNENHKSGLTLDLACGTGSLTIALKKMGIDVFGVDKSEEMLTKAKLKAEKENLDILFLCQDITELDLYGTVDTVVSSLDSINHLICCEDVQKCFDKVSLFLNDGGYFIFDVNTSYKHKNILNNNIFIYDEKSVYCVWQNNYDEIDDIVDIDLDFFQNVDKNKYLRFKESFSEKAYSVKEISQMIDNSNMKIINTFSDMTFCNAKDNDERIVYVVKRKYRK